MLFEKIVYFIGVWATIHKILRTEIQKSADSAEIYWNPSTSNVNIFWTLCQSIITNTIFWKSEMTTFKCIYVNWYKSLRVFADINKKLQKGHNFWQFKDHNSRKRHENQTNDSIFFHLLFEPWVLRKLIFAFENCQNPFSWGSPFGQFWSAKYLNVGSESCKITILPRSIQETYTLRKVNNQVSLFLLSWE